MRFAKGSLLVAGLMVASGCSQPKEITELCAAVEAKNVGEVRRLLQQGGVDLNAGQGTTGWRCNPFPAALERVEPEALTADRRGVEIATLMLDHKADVNSCWKSGSLPRGSSSRRSSSKEAVRPCVLEYAVNSQSPSFLRLVIDRGARVKSGTGARALARAAYAGDMEMARMLVEAGAPVNDMPPSGRDRGSKTPALGAAVAGGHQDMIAYVRGLPGAREFPAPSRLSGLASAVSRLFRGGQGGLTAAEQAFMSAAQTGDLAALQKAIAEGVQIDRLGEDGKSALIRASGAGHVAAVELLLKAGADPNLMNAAMTALHAAAANGGVEVIRVLVLAKADLNRRSSSDADTPLMAAVKAEKPDAVRALIAAGANTSVSDSSMTVLEYAVWRANTAVVRELVKDGRTPVNARHPMGQESPLHGALWCRNPDYNIELIQTLLAAGADLAVTDKNGDTPIKAVERKRAAEKLPYYQACYDAQVAALRAVRRP